MAALPALSAVAILTSLSNMFEIQTSNHYEYQTWGSVKEKAAIIYDLFGLNGARGLVGSQFSDDTNDYIIYTGMAVKYIEDGDLFVSYYVRKEEEYEFGHVIPPHTGDEWKYTLTTAYEQRFQQAIMVSIRTAVQTYVKTRTKPYKTTRYALVFKYKAGDWRKPQLILYPQKVVVAPRMTKDELPKFGWIQYKRMEWESHDPVDVSDKDPIDYGQFDNPEIVIEPDQNGANAMSIIDSHGFRVLNRETTRFSKGWRPNVILGFDDADVFEHFEKNMWIRHHFADGETSDHFIQHLRMVFDKKGVFVGFESDAPQTIVAPSTIYETRDAKESGVYKSHQGGVGDCVLHATNVILGGPFWNNLEFRSFGEEWDEKGTEPKPEASYALQTVREGWKLTKTVYGVGFSHGVVANAIETVGCQLVEVTMDDIKRGLTVKYGRQRNGDPKFLGMYFTYYASRKSEKGLHAIGWVYKAKGKGWKEEEGFWYVQSWTMRARRWFNIGNTIRYLSEWKTAKEKGFFSMVYKTRIYRYKKTMGFVVVDEDKYQSALSEARKKPEYTKQFGTPVSGSTAAESALIAYDNVYSDEERSEGIYSPNVYVNSYADLLYILVWFMVTAIVISSLLCCFCVMFCWFFGIGYYLGVNNQRNKHWNNIV